MSHDPQYGDYRVPILETLAAYVRERSQDDADADPTADIREIMKFLNEALSE